MDRVQIPKFLAKSLLVGAFGVFVYADGEVIVPDRLDVDPWNAGVYLRQPAEVLDLHAHSSTGDSILTFDTADILA